MDKIIINGLEIDTIIGVYNWERQNSQKVILNLTLLTELNSAMKSDQVKDTIDYAAVVERIEKLSDSHHPELVEKFADLIFADLFSAFPLAEIQLEILKPDILKQVQSVGIAVTRKKDDYIVKGTLS
ncbi:dihydroneopterin aldolase [Planctobacterium marinum]|uniref:dihydroneopterin aldolase n=1 Tax=Planctobacterium marinum TaxID=1631968 RepID=UPI001E495CE7|nr:dihydroneopterin aldolase [Planctobacterium marinum]MCC2604965.1 dihydroneopterin aldolase [Planctobacterium marinum]